MLSVVSQNVMMLCAVMLNVMVPIFMSLRIITLCIECPRSVFHTFCRNGNNCSACTNHINEIDTDTATITACNMLYL